MSLQTFFDNFALLADAPNGVAKLRELILQLAVEGRLASQNPKDEPADKAIRRAKKAELLFNVEPTETLFALPHGWAWLKLADLGRWAIGSGFPTNEQGETDEPILFCKVSDMNLEGNEKWIVRTRNSIDEETAKRIRAKTHPEGTVVFPKIGGAIATNKRRILIRPTAIDNNCLGIIPSEYCSSHWLYLLLSSIEFMQYQSGTSVPALSQGVIGEILTALPPLEEQKRIVAKVDELMRLCDKLGARQQEGRESRVRLNNATLAPLNNAASLTPEEFEQASVRLADNFAALYDSAETVSHLRSTILQLAVQGKLVPQDPHDEPALALIHRIRAEKERLVKEKRIKSAKSLPPVISDKTLFDLPSGWSWARFGDVSFYIEAGWSPQCERRSAERDEWGVLKVSSVSWDTFKPDENKALPKDVKPRAELEVRSGDFLISRANTSELVAKSVVVEETRRKLMLSDKVLRVHFPEYLDKWFFNYFNNSQTARDYYARTASGTSSSMKNISQEGISYLPVAVPPLEEQKHIVAKVNQLMALCDELETKLRQAEADSEKLMKAAVRHVLIAIGDRSTEVLAGASA